MTLLFLSLHSTQKGLQKQNLSLLKSVIEGTIHCKPGAAELLVQEVYSILTNKRYGRPGASATPHHQKPIRLLKQGQASQVKLGTQEDLVISIALDDTAVRMLVCPSMLKQSPESLASMQEKRSQTLLAARKISNMCTCTVTYCMAKCS